jgi:hypothetical protein
MKLPMSSSNLLKNKSLVFAVELIMSLNNLEDARHGFTTYKNYLLSLNYLMSLIYPDYPEILAKLKNVQRNSNVDIGRVRDLLLNSWNSEVLLNFPGLLKNDFLKFSNHWSPVQSYYSIYLALRALIIAKNFDARGDHTTTLQVVVSNFIKGEKLLPLPWGLLLDNQGFQNLPEDVSPRQINPLENPYYFRSDQNRLCDSLCLFLKTTRKRVIEEKCQDWKGKHPTRKGPRKRLPAGQRKKIVQKTKAISTFDCFYRLRIRSNYKDVDIFILGSSAPETKYYFDALCNITDKTLFVIETYLYRYLGKKNMEQTISEYQQADTLGITKHLTFSVVKRCKYYD